MFSWKALIFTCIASVVITGLFCYLMEHKDNLLLNVHIKMLEDERDSLKAEIELSDEIISEFERLADEQEIEIESLESIIKELKLQTIVKQDEIDSLIFYDSLNAIAEYRKGLKTLGTYTDSNPQLTLSEIGYGAKYFAECAGLRLQINYNDSVFHKIRELIRTKDEIISEFKKTNANLEKLAIDTELQNAAYKSELERMNSFWHKRFIFYAGYGLILHNGTVAAGPSAGIGIRIN